MKHISDNRALGHTSVYVMLNVPYLWKCKIGISDNPRSRRRSVSGSTSGVTFVCFSLRIAYGHTVETFLHGIFSAMHAPFRSGSGRSEWFLIPCAPVAIAVIFAVWCLEHLFYIAAVLAVAYCINSI